MLDPVSVALKFGFLAVLYLFLLWVARSALKDLRRGVVADAAAGARQGPLPPQPADATGIHRTGEDVFLVVDSAPGHQPGSRYDLSSGATLGRGGWTIEDLGSTNGVKIDGRRITGRTPLEPGARIALGTVDVRFVVE